MSVLKYIWFLLLAALVLGGFYLMALLGPSSAVDYTESYIDPTLEGDQLLKESEKYEKQFHQPEMFVRMGRGMMVLPLPDDMVRNPEDKTAKATEKQHPVPDRESL